MKKKLVVLLTLLHVLSCGKSSDDDTSKENMRALSNELVAEESKLHDFKITRRSDINSVHDLNNESQVKSYRDNINVKDLIITLASSESLDQSGCFTKDKELGEVETYHVPSAKTFKVSVYLKQSLAPFYVQCPIYSYEKGLEQKEFLVLPDLYINEENKEQFINWANEKNRFDHVILDLDETLYIKNRNLVINANKIVMLKMAKITNFDVLTRALDDHDGLDGSTIKITAKEAVGDIVFHLNGQRGGKVTYLPKPQTATKPENPALNGKCDSRGRNCHGRPGEVGLQGEKGFDGKRGGSTGVVNLKINKSLGLYIYIDQDAGTGSEGGQGGQGGLGQLGGYHDHFVPPPVINCGPNCVKNPIHFGSQTRNRARANSGPIGPVGEKGSRGRDGVVRPSSISVGDKTYVDIINNFNDSFGNIL